MKRLLRILPLALLAFTAGAIAAQAGGGPPAPAPSPPERYDVAPAPGAPAFTPSAAPAELAGPVHFLLPACRPGSTKGAKGAPPSQDLLNAFAILRRERTPDDALPADALKALEHAGLAPVSPDSARLLRTTATGGKAWVVPVPDVRLAGLHHCVIAPRPGAKRPQPAGKPQEGLAVVSLGDAAEGAGGALGDLVRGRAPVAVNPCGGPDRNMLSVSGLVPDGVTAVFLTAPDGTAVKADVKDNGYVILVPRPKGIGPRYVVWTGGDGTPHVQPIASYGRFPSRECNRGPAIAKFPRVSPIGGGWGACPLPEIVQKAPSGRKGRRISPAMRAPVDCVANPPAFVWAMPVMPPPPEAARKKRPR